MDRRLAVALAAFGCALAALLLAMAVLALWRRARRWLACGEKLGGSGDSLIETSDLMPTLTQRSEQVQPAASSEPARAHSASASSSVAREYPDPLMAAEAQDEGPDRGLGRVNFIVGYDWAARQLSVKVARAERLPAMDFPMGTSDPYCKISILPDTANKVKTQVRSRKLNPKWNEVFVFENFPGERLLDRTLLIRVLDYDRFSRDDPIGDVRFPLVFLFDEQRVTRSLEVWRHLQPNKRTRGYVGAVLVALSYNPQSSHLTLIALKAKELKAMDFGRSSDPYCVVKLVHSKTKRLAAKKKSIVARKTLNPQWNEPFVFAVSPDKIHEYHIELLVKDKDLIGSETIGRIRLGTRSSPEETKHWQEMTNQPRKQLAQWHTLKN